MRALADSVSIEPREGGGTCVTLRRSLSPP
jgi:hypothetical protein